MNVLFIYAITCDRLVKESDAVRLLDEERKRWIKSFEEKSALVEQLERELGHTMTALVSLSEKNCDNVEFEQGNDLTFSDRNKYISVSYKPAEAIRYYSESNLEDHSVLVTSDVISNSNQSLVFQTGTQSKNNSASNSEHVVDFRAENVQLRGLISELENSLDKVKNAWRESEAKLNIALNQVGVCFEKCCLFLIV